MGISWSQRAQGYRQLSQLLRAGIPLGQSLAQMGGGKAWQELCQQAATAIASGASIQEAFAQERPVIRAMLAWAERSGRVELACDRIADMAERLLSWRRQLFAKLAYPVLVLHGALMVPTLLSIVQGDPLWYLLLGPVGLWLVLAAMAALGWWFSRAVVDPYALGMGRRSVA